MKEAGSIGWQREFSRMCSPMSTKAELESKTARAREKQTRVFENARRHENIARIAYNPLEKFVQSLGGCLKKSENFWDGMRRVGGELLRKGKEVLGGDKRSIDVKVYSWELLQGETLAIVVSVQSPGWGIHGLLMSIFGKDAGSEDPSVRVSFGGLEFPAFPAFSDSQSWRTLIPTTPLHQPGPSPLTVEVDDGHQIHFDGVVVVSPKEYPVESIWLSEPKSKIQGTQKEKDAVKAFTLMTTSVQLWSGPFVIPSEGEITTAYGLQRFYNGKFANGYYHRGIDYGADEGTPVRAPSSGRVALVGREASGFEIHGNCVGLDHGHGVTSILMHLAATCVKEGDIVQSGQVVGLVGETGLATGPHLHWGFYVNGEAVDPQSWMKEQPWL